jgi:hypothetical protein
MIDQVYITELEKYAELEGSELGEVLRDLCHISNYSNYLSASFEKAVEKEIKTQLIYFKKNTKIVLKKVTQTLEHKELEWTNE